MKRKYSKPDVSEGFLPLSGGGLLTTVSERRNNKPHFSVRPEFKDATYLDRYRILCRKLILERHCSMAALLCTSGPEHYESLSDDTSIEKFIGSFIGHLIANGHYILVLSNYSRPASSALMSFTTYVSDIIW